MPSISATARTRTPLVARDAPGFEAEGEVIEDVEMGVEGGVLEDHGHIAAVRRDATHVPPADRPSRVRRFEPGDQPQERGLARARRAEHDASRSPSAIPGRASRGPDAPGIVPGDLPNSMDDTKREPPRTGDVTGSSLRLVVSCPAGSCTMIMT